MDTTSSSLLLLDGIVWTASGLVWFSFPRRTSLFVLPDGEQQGNKRGDDLARGFAVSLCHTGIVEVYVAAEKMEVAYPILFSTRLLMTTFLLLGWVVFHTSDFWRMPGFWGTGVAMVLPLVFCVRELA